MPLGEKLGVNSESNKKVNDTKSRTPAKKTTKKGLSSTKENQSLLTSFFKSTPKKELNKDETKKDEDKHVTETLDIIANNTPIKKSPVKKSKSAVSPEIKELVDSNTSPITRSKTKTSPAQSLASTFTSISPLTRSKTSPKVASPKDSNKSPKEKSTQDTKRIVENSYTEKQKKNQKSPPKKLCIEKENKVENTPKVTVSNQQTDSSNSNKSIKASTSTVKKNTKVTTNSSSVTRSKKASQSQIDTTDRGTVCNLEKELHDEEDAELIKNLKMSKAQLKLKETNTELFWEQAAEAIRTELQENLEDNKELTEIRKEMEAEERDLTKQQEQLMKLADEAGEICREFMQLNDDEVDDSGILD